MIKALLLLTAAIALGAGTPRAEMWCGRGPLTTLDHPCTSGDLGVWKVESVTSKNGNAEILVYVDPALGFAESTRRQIPTSVAGVPVVIFPDRLGTGGQIGSRYYSTVDEAIKRSDREKRVAAEKALADREASEKAYRLALHQYGKRWLAQPGVLGIGPSKCDADACDFGSVGITVQRQLLDATRTKIPSSVNGVPIVLIPQD